MVEGPKGQILKKKKCCVWMPPCIQITAFSYFLNILLFQFMNQELVRRAIFMFYSHWQRDQSGRLRCAQSQVLKAQKFCENCKITFTVSLTSVTGNILLCDFKITFNNIYLKLEHCFISNFFTLVLLFYFWYRVEQGLQMQNIIC